MASQSQFLVRNRHSNQWYGRVIVPLSLRDQLDGKREIRRSLNTSDKSLAKRRALEFWLQCQDGFERMQQGVSDMYRIETTDVFGKKHVFDLDDPNDEQKLAREMHENANRLLAKFGDNPEVLDRLFAINNTLLDKQPIMSNW